MENWKVGRLKEIVRLTRPHRELRWDSRRSSLLSEKSRIESRRKIWLSRREAEERWKTIRHSSVCGEPQHIRSSNRYLLHFARSRES